MLRWKLSEWSKASAVYAPLQLVEEAGKVVRQAIEDRDKKISEKSSPVDLVTETDKAVEKLIVQGLK